MTFWAILILLVLVAGLVAYVGDLVAKRVGKRHWRFLGLRPRTTATLVAIGTGVLIALGAFGTFFLLVRDARETILQAEAVRQERDRLRTEVERLENRAASIFSQYEQLKLERDEFEKNNILLARQLAQNAEFQRQTRQDLEDALVEREKLRQEVEKLQAASSAQREALEQLKQIRLSLLQEKEQLQKEKAQLLADRAALVTQARKAEQQLQTFERASREARTRLKALQARTAELEARLRQLEAEKRNLEGDIAVLVSPQAPASDGNRQLEALQRENSELKGSLTEVQRELQQLRERNKMLAASLDKSLYMSLLAEERVEPGNEQPALNEITRRVDNRIRLLGLRGVDVLIKPIPTSLKPGLLLARIQGIGADGRVRVVIEYRAREQAFSQGDVLASTYLILPASQAELRRRLDILSQNAENRLNEAGWVPEKLAKGGIAFEEFVGLASQLLGRRGGARLVVVALDNLYPTEPPRLGLRLLP
ncbi:DUF3084 domain-containing protein [Meiothermus taiwanensis]|jgi:hypothetical protein|uniref:Chromosome partition protein Smc n=2 Tax=Meiothermus taiwanensis TaxID=172827 RepID=A0A399E0A8_9DEIN|nr:DUF3084 domain-containing protein [Meiothermus taiwanensis]AWR85803.1 hypothetical protein Mtai_v1c05560 [Meiothermus taiwanensis WR-220]KIQ54825.1 myosin [Meiothermus taiwanensis]KZK16121.1 hypothetical protein A3962_07785 [Meiothermus taiwanensis]RIH77128.1 Chromosome partition protein Smc [Meiothermus taiwanensis]